MLSFFSRVAQCVLLAASMTPISASSLTENEIASISGSASVSWRPPSSRMKGPLVGVLSLGHCSPVDRASQGRDELRQGHVTELTPWRPRLVAEDGSKLCNIWGWQTIQTLGSLRPRAWSWPHRPSSPSGAGVRAPVSRSSRQQAQRAPRWWQPPGGRAWSFHYPGPSPGQGWVYTTTTPTTFSFPPSYSWIGWSIEFLFHGWFGNGIGQSS